MADYELKDIRTDLLEPSQKIPVVIDFWAPWCGPCKTLGPVLEKLAAKANGKWKLVKVNVDEEQNQQLASQFQIRSIPGVRMLHQGKLLASFDGALPEAQVRQWLKEHVPGLGENDASEEEDSVEEQLKKGNREAALKAARREYEENPEDEALRVQLALLHLPDDIESAAQLTTSLEQEGKFEVELQSIAVVKQLAEAAEKGVEASVKDAQPKLAERYEAGAEALFNKEFELAAEHFIHIIMVDRSFMDDAGRKACVALFKLLGEAHPVTLKWRRRFSMALY
jgi:putative thioredoxin